MALDPITEGLTLGEKIIDLIRFSIPTEAERAQRWILHYPNKYRRAKKKVLDQIYNDLRASFHPPTIEQISNIVEYEQGQLPYTEKEDLKCVLQDRFGITA